MSPIGLFGFNNCADDFDTVEKSFSAWRTKPKQRRWFISPRRREGAAPTVEAEGRARRLGASQVNKEVVTATSELPSASKATWKLDVHTIKILQPTNGSISSPRHQPALYLIFKPPVTCPSSCSDSSVLPLDSLVLRRAARKVLVTISDADARELARDFLINQFFRRDVFVRAGRRLNQKDRRRRLRETTFSLSSASRDQVHDGYPGRSPQIWQCRRAKHCVRAFRKPCFTR